ncbi:hypothetical protein [Massilia pseudoviolaceinigra]|uniref:hypothetical protein n=1 Tax=Massilia pseudoviolaceinigra TaxID=3057165 RepID=UPI0027967991|nr:hypothetical protein [Massilia sp. CCM 9206]MDQ1919366.1 hypothetical protein [Massilia sp. CCM 9206]
MDMTGEPRDHGNMEARITKLEADVAAMKIDIGVIRATGATKSDIAEVRAEIRSEIAGVRSEIRSTVAEAKSVIIMWVAGLVFLAQLVPAAVRLIEKYV